MSWSKFILTNWSSLILEHKHYLKHRKIQLQTISTWHIETVKPILYVSLILRTAMFEHTTGNYGHFISSLKIKTTFTLTCWLETSSCSFVSFILPYNNLKLFWIHLDPACTCKLPAHLQCQTETAQNVSLTVVCVWQKGNTQTWITPAVFTDNSSWFFFALCACKHVSYQFFPLQICVSAFTALGLITIKQVDSLKQDASCQC